MRAYGDEAVGRILERLRVMVLLAKEQPEDSKQYGSLQNTTQFGVAAQVTRAVSLHCASGPNQAGCAAIPVLVVGS